MSDAASALTPEQRRRNLVLGSLLGLLTLVLIGTFMIIFSRNGLPKDPATWNRLQQQTAPDAGAERGKR